VAPLLAVAAVLGVVFHMNARDRAQAMRAATAELQRHLQPGERVIGQAWVLQRQWQDLYRATYGVLAATDSRTIYVGVVPELSSAPDEPRTLDVQSFIYDTTFTISAALVPLSTRGVLLSSGGRARRIGISSEEPALTALITAARRRSFSLAEARRRERAYHDSMAALPPLREYHRVERGEALESIARRYGTTMDLIRTLNQLLSDRIVVGQVLIVRETPRPIPPCPPSICGDDPERKTPEDSTGS
jgi:hypothetical protein